MFTGIIQATGEVVSFEPDGDAFRMVVRCPELFAQVKPGDSVANNGVCLTVETSNGQTATFTLIHQTIQATGFRSVKAGSVLNLELPCKADTMLGGHYVMGHVDAVGEVLAIIPRETGQEVELALPKSLMRYVINKGSITLHGVSLTVAERLDSAIRVALIPETLRKTNLGLWKLGEIVNVEVDPIGKYVENFLSAAGLVPKAE